MLDFTEAKCCYITAEEWYNVKTRLQPAPNSINDELRRRYHNGWQIFVGAPAKEVCRIQFDEDAADTRKSSPTPLRPFDRCTRAYARAVGGNPGC
jgi:hypothetical protein